MKEYIELVDAVTYPVQPKDQRGRFNDIDEAYEAGWKNCLEAIATLPAADVRPVKRGKWLRLSRGDVCSECKYQTGRYEHGGNFCPNCGADMREESNG